MPSDLSYWIISAPLKDGDAGIMLSDVRSALGDSVDVGQWEVPELKTGTLSQLLSLSDMLPKLDGQFTGTVSKTLDTLRSLTDDGRLSQHARINDRPVDEALMQWKWDRGRWGEGGKVAEVIDALTKEMNSIDSVQKQRTQAYNLVKGNMTNLQRKRTGNLSQRSLLEVVKKEDLVQDSEFMETLVVAVPKNLIKDWEAKYERLTSMVVPRSSQQVAADDDFSLRTVTVFKKVRDEFTHRCRENKFIVRDFHYEDSALEKQRKELSELEVEEKELWSELLKLTRINFSESYQILAHLKTVRLFVESALRYGLPAEYAGVIVRPEPKTAVNVLKTLSSQYSYLAAASQGPSSRKNKKSGGVTAGSEEVGGEWQSVMEAEFYDFVLFEIPKVDFQG